MYDNSFWGGASTPWGNIQFGSGTFYGGVYGGYPAPYPYPGAYPVPGAGGGFMLDGLTLLIIGVVVVLLIAK